MKTKEIQYGTTHKVNVVQSADKLIVVIDENKEGYFLMGHGLKELPNVGDKGTIVFTQKEGGTKGYWDYKTN